jgi:sulfofructosephosphate aldolase
MLAPFLSPAGAICGLAVDHRDALRNAFARAGTKNVSGATMSELKERIVGALAQPTSAMLLDAATMTRVRPVGPGVFVALEAQGHEAVDRGRVNRLLDDFGPAAAAAIGADGCKVLLHYRPDHRPSAVRQRALAAGVAGACHRARLPLVVEPIVYRLDGEDEAAYADAFPDLVVAAARDLAASGADLLKLQFPGSDDACERITEAAAPLPWTLLGGAAVAPETFEAQLVVACEAGASGFIAGRPIWGGVLSLDAASQGEWLQERARPLLEQLVTIADTYARRLR